MNPNDEVEIDCSPLFLKYKSGRFKRLKETDLLPASVDPATAVASKDVCIDPVTGVSARIYLPPLSSPPSKLPILVYYHGGAFIIESPFSPLYHSYFCSLAAKGNILAISVDYRLVPEHPLPTTCEDSLACPTTEEMDDPLINPLAATAPSLKEMACRRVVVFVAGKDILRERGRAYYKALVSCGWEGKAELVEDEGVEHVFHLSDPAGEKAVRKMERMVDFLRE